MKNILISLLLLSSLAGYSQNNKFPDKTLHTLDGKTISGQSLGNNGKPYAVCFWAVWNKSSLLELNNLMDNYVEWHNKYGIKIYAISIDEEERISRAKLYAQTHEWKYEILFDKKSELENALGIVGVPHIMLFDGNGNVVWQEHEYHSGLELDFLEQVKKLK